MPLPSSLLLDDRDRQFDDWGEEITFREVTATYTPETGLVEEVHVDTTLTAIVGDVASSPSAATAGHHLTAEIILLIKAEDLPTSSPTPTSRIVRNSQQYDVVEFTLSAHNLTISLRCRRSR